jgi:bifunctional DNA-binding transcriptional regulator/antitoxin component of YhaV-PrlF toxin-antitoxin module
MAGKVGPKGQVVAEQRIRQQLGIRPGMRTVQRVADDHVELRFLPAEHTRSLAGVARPYIRRWPAPEEFDDLGRLWAEEARQKYRGEPSERDA